MSAERSGQSAENAAIEWGLNYDGCCYALDREVPMTLASAEQALRELRAFLGEPDVGEIVRRAVGPWQTVARPGVEADRG